MLLYLFKRTNYGKKTVEMLHMSAYQSQYYKKCTQHIAHTDNVNHINEIKNIFDDNKALSTVIEEEEKHVKRIKTVKDAVIEFIPEEKDYMTYFRSNAYIGYINQRRRLLGCGPVLYPNGYILDLLFTRIELPPGHVENIILYMCNNDQFFNMIYYIDKNKRFGSLGRILVYIVKESVVFVLSQFLAALVQYYSVDHAAFLNPIVKLFFITPISIIVGKVLIYMYTVPCTETDDTLKSSTYLKWLILLLSRSFIAPLLVLISGALIVACLFTTGDAVPYILLNFFFTVQLFSIILHFVQILMGFQDNYFLRLYVFGKVIISVGDLFVENIVVDGLVLGTDYFCRQQSFLCKIISVTTILSRADAMKKGWLVECSKSDSIPVAVAVEMKPVIDITGANNGRFDGVVVNPIISNEATRLS